MLPGSEQRTKRKPNAHTLLEVMISSTLFMLLMGSLATILVMSNRYVRNAETKIAAQTEALAASVWISRNLTESNVTTSLTNASPVGVSFPSPRDPNNGDVAWAGSNVGALIWRQVRFCYHDSANSRIVMKGYPIQLSGTTPSVQWTGFPPFPGGTSDLLPSLSTPFPGAILTMNSPITKVVANSIRQFSVTLYQPDAPVGPDPLHPDPQRAATIVIESFSPAYNLDYGVRIQTTVRLHN